MVMPRVMTIEENNNSFTCGRMQAPLCVNYALTVHKGQGLTLQRVNAYVHWGFCYGQLDSANSTPSRICRFQDLVVVVIVGNIGSETKCALPTVGEWFFC